MSFNPLIWKGFSLSDKSHEQLFIGQLSDLLNFLTSPQGLATLLNGSQLLGASAFQVSAGNLGNVTTNQTINCAQCSSVSGALSVTTNFGPLVTFSSFPVGAPFSFRFTNAFSAPVTLRFAATTPSGSSYTIVAFSNTATTDMGTGLSVGNGLSAMFSGASYGTSLDLLVNVT